MMLTLADMFALIGVELPEKFRDRPFPSHIATDSRNVRPDGAFVALEGAKVDGHNFVVQAAERGASLIIVRKGKHPSELDKFSTCVVELDDPELDLARMASRYLDWCLNQDASALREVVAVTGSVGKTTTRTALERVLSRKFRVHAATGSLNTRIGCTATVLAMPVDTELLLLEFGANKPGEIAELAELFPPTVALITQVAPVHLEGFKTLEGVLRAKMEITSSRNLKCFLYNADNNLLCDAAKTMCSERHLVTSKAVGNAQNADFKIEDVCFEFADSRPSLAFKLNHGTGDKGDKTEIRAAVWGEHISLPLSMAAATGNYLGMSLDDCAAALQDFQGLPGRGRILTLAQDCTGTGNTRFIVDDAYNANPASMRASLETFIKLAKNAIRGRVAILGEMREMGNDAAKYHAELADLIDRLDAAILVGYLWRVLPEKNGRIFVSTWQDALACIQDKNLEWQGLLVKGSQSIGLQNIVKVLAEGTNS